MASSSKRTHEFLSSPSRPAAPSVKSEEHIDDVDATMLRQDVLIPRSRDSSSRQPGLPSVTHNHYYSSTTAVVIPPHQQNIYTYPNGRDVPPALSDASRPPFTSTSSSLSQQHVRSHPEHPLSSNNHASLNNPSDRPRTQLPVFGTTSELAAHYGIPRRFPPTPNVNNPTSTKPQVPTTDFNESHSSSSSSDDRELVDFQYQLAAYMNMMSTTPQEPADTPSAMAVPPVQPTPDVSAVDHVVPSDVMDMLAVRTPGLGWDEFLTSPFDDSPAGDFDFLETPANAASSLGDDFFTSPLVADMTSSYDPSFTDIPVFADDFTKTSVNSMPPPPPPSTMSLNAQFDNLFTMSPLTPAIDASPQATDLSTFPPAPPLPSKVNKKGPTGTRKNVTPETLVPLDAPTQPRNYLAPSTTSRKELPAVFAKKRARSMAFDEEDELEGDEAAPTGSEADAIAAKRRQNTLAARRSRKRKLEYQRDLENAVETERQEKEMWRGKALFYEAHMHAMGYQVPHYAPLS